MKHLLLMQMLILINMLCYCQSISYDYDDSGNRTERSITLLKSTSSSNTEGAQEEVFNDKLGALDIEIYPNPVNSELNVNISGLEESEDVSITLFDQGGRLVMQKNDISSTNIIYMGNLIPGTYFMIIQAGNQTTRWKVIKQ